MGRVIRRLGDWFIWGSLLGVGFWSVTGGRAWPILGGPGCRLVGADPRPGTGDREGLAGPSQAIVFRPARESGGEGQGSRGGSLSVRDVLDFARRVMKDGVRRRPGQLRRSASPRARTPRPGAMMETPDARCRPDTCTPTGSRRHGTEVGERPAAERRELVAPGSGRSRSVRSREIVVLGSARSRSVRSPGVGDMEQGRTGVLRPRWG